MIRDFSKTNLMILIQIRGFLSQQTNLLRFQIPKNILTNYIFTTNSSFLTSMILRFVFQNFKSGERKVTADMYNFSHCFPSGFT